MIQTLLTSLAVLFRIVSNPLGNVFQKQLINQGRHPLLINFLTYFVLSISCIAVSFTVSWNSFPGQFWLYSIIAGILSAAGNGFLIKALEKGDISVLGPINAYKSLIGMLGGFILLREIPGLWGIAGTALIIFGSYLILDTTEARFSWKLLKRSEIQFRFLALLLTAIEAVYVKKIILITSISAALVSWCWFGAIFSFCFLLFHGINPKTEIRKISFASLGKLCCLVLSAAVMQFSTLYCLSHMPVGYALSLFQLSSIGSVLLGYQFFNEQDIRKKLIGSFIMVLGSIVIILD